MGRKRNKIEIVRDTLEAIREAGNRIKRTHLMYKANLSHTQMLKIIAELEPKGLALAAMVKSINGVEIDDITTSGLQKTLDLLQRIGITKKELEDTADGIKKKSNKSLKYSFLSSLREKISSIIRH